MTRSERVTLLWSWTISHLNIRPHIICFEALKVIPVLLHPVNKISFKNIQSRIKIDTKIALATVYKYYIPPTNFKSITGVGNKLEVPMQSELIMVRSAA